MIELAGALIVEEAKVLLLYNSDEKLWEVPGGKIEGGVSPTQAAVRETAEEIGVSVELEKPFYSGEFQSGDNLFEWHGYLASINEGRPEINESEKFDELKWFSKEDLENCNGLAPNIRMIEHGLKRLLN